MTDSSGTVVWSADYKPFGEATITVSTITNNLRFPGQYYDAETGLNYNYFRDYNPAIGRYLESDPIGTRNGTNHLYVYVSDNPVMGVDPRGLYDPFQLNYQFVEYGPKSCGPCEQSVVIKKANGYAELGDPTSGLEEPAFFFFAPQLYRTEVTRACLPSCCKKTNDVTKTGTGPMTPQNWYINNVFTFTWKAEYAQFDCSDCLNPCKKCKK